jgi:lipopolysaccharide transport system ATP-binding protein
MSDIAIEANELGKRYTIGHKASGERYTALRDVLARNASTFWRKSKDLLRGRPIIEGDQLEEIWALKNVSFDIRRGECVGIIGQNGAGKSTLLKVLSRITEPTVGRVVMVGQAASLLEVGTGFHPELTGRENIFLNGAILGMKQREIKRKFDEIVAFAEVENFIDTPVKRYSSGMYVRLAFAVAAHLEPDILIVDEVLAVGDFAFQKKCLGKMSEVGTSGTTVLFVSHNMVAVRMLCSRAILLERGDIVADGDVNKTVDAYLAQCGDSPGFVEWENVEEAPGDQTVRLRAVNVYSNRKTTGQVDIHNDFEIHIDYYVLRENSRLLVSLHLQNSQGETILVTANLRSVSTTPDSWVDRQYPTGLFRTICAFPGRLLNSGKYSATLFINDDSALRHHVHVRDVVSFDIIDSGYMCEEYQGPWPGVLRMKLPWATEQRNA